MSGGFDARSFGMTVTQVPSLVAPYIDDLADDVEDKAAGLLAVDLGPDAELGQRVRGVREVAHVPSSVRRCPKPLSGAPDRRSKGPATR